MRLIRRSIGGILMTLQLAGCSTYQPSKLAPEAAVQERDEVRVRLTDGSSVQLATPWVRDDSLGGLLVRGGGAYAPSRETTAWAVPLDAVAAIEIKQFSTGATIGWTLGIAGGLMLLGAMVCASGGCAPQVQLGGS